MAAAQAKINLRLRVLAREDTGFHQIETLFLRLALADTVRLRRTPSVRSLDVSGVADPTHIGPVHANLAWRAAEAYFDVAGWRGGFAIELEKRIPIGGGLGGGSADAGAVLRILDAISAEPLGEPTLLRIAGLLGSDVAFLTTSHPYALGWGRGDRLLVLPPPPARDLMLVVPPFGVSTAAAYGWLAEHRAANAGTGGTDSRILDPRSLGDWDGIAAIAVNDLEMVVAGRHPEITAVVDSLRARGCTVAMMSGSGSSVFGVSSSPTVGQSDSRTVGRSDRRAQGEAPLVGPGGPATVREIATATATHVEPVLALD
jgi:4-diphosphocytidyl-2-C-methyl-D-erythritol kinase